MADLNLSPVKETAEASVILTPTWLQEVRPYVSLASEVLSPQHAWAVPAAGSLQGWLRTAWEAFSKMSHISRVVVFDKKRSSLRGILSGLGFMRNASLRGSFSQALTIFQRAHRKLLSRILLATFSWLCFSCIGTSQITVRWVWSDWEEALFPVNNLSLLNPDCHLPRTYLISHLSKYSIMSPVQLVSDSITLLITYHTYLQLHYLLQ